MGDYRALLGGAGTTLNLSASTFIENSALNTVIGTLSVSGGTGTYTYSFQSNPGTLFNISGSSLRVTSTTIAAGSYPVTIRADNGAGSVIDKVFMLTATASSSPLLSDTGVSILADVGTPILVQ